MIEQIIIEKQVVQTELRVKVDGVNVIYRRCENEFGYIITVPVGDYEGDAATVEAAERTAEKIVDAMESQSYDHGAEWRRTSFTSITDDEYLERYRVSEYKVIFRIRDSY